MRHFAAALAFVSSQALALCMGDNTKPMFGYDPAHAVTECDQRFLTRVKDEPKPAAYERVLALGWEAVSKQDLSTAIKRFNQAWLIDRENVKSLHAFGVWEQKKGNLSRAEEFLRKTLSRDPKFVEAANDLGNVLFNKAKGRAEAEKTKIVTEADSWFRKALALRPAFAPAHINRAVALYFLDRIPEAKIEIETAEKENPKLVETSFRELRSAIRDASARTPAK